MNIIKRTFNKLHYLYVSYILQVDEKESIRNGRNQFEDKYLAYDTFPEITDEELTSFRETWPMFNVEKRDLTWARVYKKYWGFSPYIIGNWHTYLLRNQYNPHDQLSSFENKALCDIYFPEIPYPRAFVRRINGIYYDHEMNAISKVTAMQILKKEGEYVIKPSFGTMQGEGVQILSKEILQGNIDSVIEDSFEAQKSDFIAQEILQQHRDISKLNPTSLNCCRVTTIYIGGKLGHSTCLKVGKLGSNVDNWHSSYILGVDENGNVKERGFDNKLGAVFQTDNGIQLKGIKLPHYVEMVNLVENFHRKYFPNCGTIGWDVVVDVDNKVRVIEINLTTPGIVAEQLASGDFFKDFHEEINQLFK